MTRASATARAADRQRRPYASVRLLAAELERRSTGYSPPPVGEGLFGQPGDLGRRGLARPNNRTRTATLMSEYRGLIGELGLPVPETVNLGMPLSTLVTHLREGVVWVDSAQAQIQSEVLRPPVPAADPLVLTSRLVVGSLVGTMAALCRQVGAPSVAQPLQSARAALFLGHVSAEELGWEVVDALADRLPGSVFRGAARTTLSWMGHILPQESAVSMTPEALVARFGEAPVREVIEGIYLEQVATTGSREVPPSLEPFHSGGLLDLQALESESSELESDYRQRLVSSAAIMDIDREGLAARRLTRLIDSGVVDRAEVSAEHKRAYLEALSGATQPWLQKWEAFNAQERRRGSDGWFFEVSDDERRAAALTRAEASASTFARSVERRTLSGLREQYETDSPRRFREAVRDGYVSAARLGQHEQMAEIERSCPWALTASVRRRSREARIEWTQNLLLPQGLAYKPTATIEQLSDYRDWLLERYGPTEGGERFAEEFGFYLSAMRGTGDFDFEADELQAAFPSITEAAPGHWLSWRGTNFEVALRGESPSGLESSLWNRFVDDLVAAGRPGDLQPGQERCLALRLRTAAEAYLERRGADLQFLGSRMNGDGGKQVAEEVNRAVQGAVAIVVRRSDGLLSEHELLFETMRLP